MEQLGENKHTTVGREQTHNSWKKANN